MSLTPILESVQIGPPQARGWDGAPDPMDRPWTSGIFKTPVSGPVAVEGLGLAGDAQADLVNHGGADKAVCAYPADHFDHWRAVLARPDLGPGAFGENFTMRGLTERDVCIGDTWRIGDLLVQVSQPRQPCWKLARRWRTADFADQVIAAGRTGWYFRVLRPATVSAGLSCGLIERPYPEWTVSAANAVRYDNAGAARARGAELAEVPLLSASWRRALRSRAEAPASPGGAQG